MTKNIIVIGSGFGGIAAALRAKSKGYDVTLVEKHADLGGRARVFKRNKFIYDGGPTVITAPYLIYELFDLFGKDYKKYIEIKPLPIWYRFVFEDNTHFDYSDNEERMQKQIEQINKDDYVGYKKLLKFTEKIFEKGFTELSQVPFNNPLFMLKQLPSLLKLKSYKSLFSLVSSFIKDEKLRRVFSMHPLLVGGNPFTTTSIYGLILYLEKKWGIHYSMGGTGKIIEALEKLMNEVNYEKLIEKKETNIFFNIKRSRMDYSMGLFVMYFGTKKKYESIQHHTIKFGKKYKEHLEDIFENKKLNQDISYYLHRPSATDSSMCPDNHDCFYVLVPVPNNSSSINWSTEGEKMRDLIINKMEKDLMPELRKNIVEDFYLTPDYFEKELNTKYGSGFSIQPKFSQSAYFRYHNQSEIYKNLYFVGAGTHPGAGVPGVLSSAKVLDKIL